MAQIFPGRFTAPGNQSFVVFLIGMRINRLLQFGKWIPVARAMPPMIAELTRQPELGLLHAELLLYWRGIMSLQYWRSFEDLHAYAHIREGLHLPAWAEFNRRVGGNGSVGIWHETYTVTAGQYECIHVNMPRFGLLRSLNPVAVVGRLESARARMSAAGPETKP